MQSHVITLLAEDEERRAKERRKEFAEVTRNLHHLLSTRTTAGIYNSPYSDPVTVGGIPIEDHLKKATKDLLLESGVHSSRKNSKQGSSLKISLQASSKYNAVIEEERKETKFKKLKRLTKKDFISVGSMSSTKYEAGYVNSIYCNTSSIIHTYNIHI